jgi:hypothetical protein
MPAWALDADSDASSALRPARRDVPAEIPWDRPDPEPWPPTATEEPIDEAEPTATAEPEPQATADIEMQATDEAFEPVGDQPFAFDAFEGSDEQLEVEDDTDMTADEAGFAQAEAAAGDAPWQPQPAPWDPTPAPWEATAAPWDEPQAAAEPEVDADAVAEFETDATVSGTAPWDTPEPYSMFEDDVADDRPTEMLESYDEMAPVVARAVAASTAGDDMSDPDDAMAPVLKDIEQPAAPEWQWSARPPEFSGKALGPTPPRDLFAEPEVPTEPEAPTEPEVDEEPLMSAEDGGAEAPDFEAAAETDDESQPLTASQSLEAPDEAPVVTPQPSNTTVVTTALPNFYSTAPSTPPQQPMVLRIEVAIVDGKVQPVDTARSVGPWSDDSDADAVTVRHPDFEPRTHVAPTADEPVEETPEPPDALVAMPEAEFRSEPEPEPEFEAEPEQEPEVSAHPDEKPSQWMSVTDKPVDVPWALPPLEPLPGAQPQSTTEATDVPAAPAAAPAEEQAPAQPSVMQQHLQAVHDPWAMPAPAWMNDEPAVDPVAELRAAAYPTPADPTRAAVAASVGATAAPPSPVAKKSADGEQSDLWFLAAEPTADVADAAAEKSSTNLWTVGLTIAMAIIVIVLIVVFLSLMTSLLR